MCIVHSVQFSSYSQNNTSKIDDDTTLDSTEYSSFNSGQKIPVLHRSVQVKL